MEQVNEVSKKYSQALFSLAREKGKVDNFKDELEDIDSVLDNNKELKKAFYHQRILPKEKKDFIEKIFYDKSVLILNFIYLIIDKHREQYLAGIIKEYNRLYNKEMHILEVEVVSAVELEKQSQQQLKNKLKKLLDSTIVLKVSKDPQIIGGLVIKIGDYIIDGSIRNQLKMLQKRIKEIPVKELGV